MAKQPSVKALAKRMAARRIAAKVGAPWDDLPLKEQLAQIGRAQSEVRQEDRRNALLHLAKKHAQQTGANWQDLSGEERRTFIARVRSDQQ
jgi:hypothetical protein